MNVPNASDWINPPTAGSCVMCHTGEEVILHMRLNGGLVSVPDGSSWTNRFSLESSFESCVVCHGPGKTADLNVVHNR